MIFDLEQIARNLYRRAYRFIGSGSGRQVYDLGNGYVVKMAKNMRGIAQNKAEYQISLHDESGLFAQIAQVSADFRMIIMEKAERLGHISTVWKYYGVRSNRELYNIPAIKEAMARNSLLFADLCRPQNWGLVRRKPVIIDYGFTRSVNRNYY